MSTMQANQPGRPSVGRCYDYWRLFRPPLEKKRWVLRSSSFTLPELL